VKRLGITGIPLLILPIAFLCAWASSQEYLKQQETEKAPWSNQEEDLVRQHYATVLPPEPSPAAPAARTPLRRALHPPYLMQWEYKIIHAGKGVKVETKLNELGQEGWELVLHHSAVLTRTFVLKRRSW